ncbi:MAG: hypothetical protein FWD09_00245 [Lentimicrobiaceae bacterium]|nr:hypothetical protein [Lentimicrobiaceae bacterium]
MDAPFELIINTYLIITYDIVVWANPYNGGVVNGGGTYKENESVTVTATPEECYRFVSWTSGATVLSTLPTFTFNATSDSALTANFTSLIPIFTGIRDVYCADSDIPALPTTSNNGILGTWSPEINNTETTEYLFTATSDECTTPATITITIVPNVEPPTFAGVQTTRCTGAVIPLPRISDEGIKGTWLPEIDNTETTEYTFTPDPGECATTATITITIINEMYDAVNNLLYNVRDLQGICWTAKNLHAKLYQSGEDIPFVTYYSSRYADIAQNESNFGLLYNWYAATGMGIEGNLICPAGWRLPTPAELATLNMYAANDLKNPDFWLHPNSNTNIAGLDVRGAGLYNSNTQRFENLYGYTAFWSSDEPTATGSLAAQFTYYCNRVETVKINLTDAISVRCVRD